MNKAFSHKIAEIFHHQQQNVKAAKVIRLECKSACVTPVDDAVITVGILISIGLYSGVFLADHPSARSYVRHNLGAPFIIAFIVLLITSAIMFSINDTYYANLLSEYAYFAILLGVILQAISLKWGNRE